MAISIRQSGSVISNNVLNLSQTQIENCIVVGFANTATTFTNPPIDDAGNTYVLASQSSVLAADGDYTEAIYYAEDALPAQNITVNTELAQTATFLTVFELAGVATSDALLNAANASYTYTPRTNWTASFIAPPTSGTFSGVTTSLYYPDGFTLHGYFVIYSGTFPNGANNGYAGFVFTCSGFVNSQNNGTFQCVASTSTALTLFNAFGTGSDSGTVTIQTGSWSNSGPFLQTGFGVPVTQFTPSQGGCFV